MRKLTVLFAVACCLISLKASPQGIAINDKGGGVPDPSAMLDIISSTKGLLIPRMTRKNRDEMPRVSPGLLIYQLDGIPGFYYFTGVFWIAISTYMLQENIFTNGKWISGDMTDKGLYLDDNGIVIGKGDFGLGNDLAENGGPDSKLIWYPKKAAFRVGYVQNKEWDNENIGINSFAAGMSTIASGNTSTALGSKTKAVGDYSTALGVETYARSERSIAIGFNSSAISQYCIALGYSCEAGSEDGGKGEFSTAIGYGAKSGGKASIALGYTTQASGEFSAAIGTYVTTNEKSGSVIIGDNSIDDFDNRTSNDAANQMMMRFAGGYKLFSNAAANIGVQVAPGGNAWAVISDRSRKEKFAPVDCENVLTKIAALNLTSWNYKGQDPKQYRHYGPLAQEFYAAFGKDQYGSIGNDTTINQADFDGINLIAIQALEKRTSDLKKENEALTMTIKEQQGIIESIRAENQELKALRSQVATLIQTVQGLSSQK